MSSTPTVPSEWAKRRFGDAAEALVQAVPAAAQRAQARACAAHIASGLTSSDAYGPTMRVALHEALVDFTSDIPGVTARKPLGVRSRFPYVVVEETSVALMPWRFAADGSVRRVDAKFPVPVSDLRKTMLGLGAHPSHTQPTFEETSLDIPELEEMFADEAEVLEQLRSMGTVVTIGLASNPVNGIVSLGWGDAQLTDTATGKVTWHTWEDLRVAPAVPLALRPVTARPGPDDNVPRFDDAPEDDLYLAPQPPMIANPTGEVEESEQGSDTNSRQSTT
ncbi:hypothetical protein [Cellulosimicrobium sp. KWT-B]|uniref:hypothetical protein n=1 Tax=Cellulosimicrobium sp. KWT-B TaxID=1981152 RepID=UPI00117748F3|nr:hypothetical protein [Cellulosimicrobium sp. KWT-B]